MAALLQENKGFRWPQLSLSILLHLGIAAALLWRFHPDPVVERPPVSVELWAGGGTGQGKGASGYLPDAGIAKQGETTPSEPPAPTLTPTPSITPPTPSEPVRPIVPTTPTAPTVRPSIKTPSLPHADVKLAETKPAPKPSKPHEPALPTQKKPVSKPEPSQSAVKSTVKPQVPPTASTHKGPATGAKPHGGHPARPGAKSGNALDDLLGDLDGPAGSGRDAVSQKGQAHGMRSGSPSGSGVNKEAYMDKVRAKVRPYVIVPPSINGNPEAVVKVILLPSLEVRSVQLIKSSGNAAYDKSVVDAVWQAKTFPHLPQGAAFVDFREYTLRFRPRE